MRLCLANTVRLATAPTLCSACLSRSYPSSHCFVSDKWCEMGKKTIRRQAQAKHGDASPPFISPPTSVGVMETGRMLRNDLPAAFQNGWGSGSATAHVLLDVYCILRTDLLTSTFHAQHLDTGNQPPHYNNKGNIMPGVCRTKEVEISTAKESQRGAPGTGCSHSALPGDGESKDKQCPLALAILQHF